jgi:hypothetical protein
MISSLLHFYATRVGLRVIETAGRDRTERLMSREWVEIAAQGQA